MANGSGKGTPINVTVKTGTTIGSTYAQIVGVVVTDTDITLEFAYFNPRPGNKEAQVVSRVTLPRVAGEGLANTIINTVKEHESKKKGGNKNDLHRTN